MLGNQSFVLDRLSTFIETAWLDFPAEVTKALAGVSDDDQLQRVGWKVYDAWIGLANELTNTLYSDPLFGEVSGRVIETALRLRHLAGAAAAAFFGNFWPLIGLPTHRELVALRQELLALREELRSFAHLSDAHDRLASDSPSVVPLWKQTQTGYGPANGHPIRPPSRQGERNVAA